MAKNTEQKTPAPEATPHHASPLDLEAKVEALAEVVAAISEGKTSATFAPTPEKKSADNLPVFAVEGVAYKFRTHGFTLDGSHTYDSAAVAEDEAFCALIVKDYPGLVELM